MSGRRLGVNVDPDHVDPNHPDVNSPHPTRLLEHGITAVRLVSRDLPRVRSYAQLCKENGIFVLGIVTSQSNGFVLDEANAVQIGNEPDADPNDSKSSMVMSENDFVNFWNQWRQDLPDRHLITAGLLRANPNWHWEDVAPRLVGVNGIARHSYRERNPPEELRTALENVRAPLPDVPLWITEWHPAPGNIERSETLALASIIDELTVADFFYCWSDNQTPGRGLFTEDGVTAKDVMLQYVQRPGAS